ncbi:MAG: GDSL-type esterase/lipase family protein [Pseudomonadota bacterium]
MIGRLADRLLYGVLFALILLGAVQLLANRVEPLNRGMVERPCPPAEGAMAANARLMFLTLAGRPNETRDWAELCIYQRDNAALMRRGQEVRAVFLGDSITRFWPEHDPALFSGEIVGRGISGQASPHLLVRLQPDALALKPRMVHLLVGLNDIVGTRGWSRPQDYRNNIESILAIAKARGVPVIVGSILPAASTGWGSRAGPVHRIREMNQWLRAIASRDGLVYADYWSAMAQSDGTMRAGYADDGVHPNAAGYAVMGRIARAALEQGELAAERPTNTPNLPVKLQSAR